jgi:hypothetical protein
MYNGRHVSPRRLSNDPILSRCSPLSCSPSFRPRPRRQAAPADKPAAAGKSPTVLITMDKGGEIVLELGRRTRPSTSRTS